MAKPLSKPAARPAAMGKILYCEHDVSVLSVQAKVFERAGYTVECAQGRVLAEQALLKGGYDVVVLGHTLTKDDRHHLPYKAKKVNEGTRVLVLHASGKHPAVDYSMDSRAGEKAVIEALGSLMEERLSMAG